MRNVSFKCLGLMRRVLGEEMRYTYSSTPSSTQMLHTYPIGSSHRRGGHTRYGRQ